MPVIYTMLFSLHHTLPGVLFPDSSVWTFHVACLPQEPYRLSRPVSGKDRVRRGWQKRHVSGSGFGWHGESWRAPSSQDSKQSVIVCYTCVQCVRETRVCSKESLHAIVFLVFKVKFKIESSKEETVLGFRSMSYFMLLNVTYYDYDY